MLYYAIILLIDKNIKQEFELAFTHLRNRQAISAYNLFLKLAEKEKKLDGSLTALLFVLAAECKARQGKDNHSEFLKAGKQYLKIANADNSYSAKNAYLCAAKCFLRVGNYDEAKDVFKKYESMAPKLVEKNRPVLIVEDSNAVVMKLKNYLQQLGYDKVYTTATGKEALHASEKLLDATQSPVVLLDMGLPDMDGDVVANKLLESRLDIPIILITADEKSSQRVHKTISEGATAFIQKPFTIDDLEKALEKVETDDIILKKQK